MPFYFTELNGEVYFRASNAVTGYELWKTDGTPAGTVMVKDINPAGNGNPFPGFHMGEPTNYQFHVLGNMMFFLASDGTNGFELWRSDGTDAGTVMVKDINTDPLGDSSIFWMGIRNGRLIFNAYDPVNGMEPWTSDGTEEGTYMIKDVCPNACWGIPGEV
ncbi:MAG: hyalin, partial [Deltaproteobacteria bacterium]|nr:hyalin [Deltaproteobacteria bacterium]